ncbi:hypothetical protein [Herbaspirillum sp.]|uniref:hypothetical protein n=1 Tax=Herbaspirillum sp. TaxID=1890675 RepID=UPI001B2CF135|nr:hypothetical protein [Herbaspirillum sp.]MBO9538751.1 hypothetical protein [Herbaspirillum sp.]
MTKVAYLVSDASPVAPQGGSQEQRFKVLTAEVAHRLSKMNAASRKLRQMGYRIVGEILADTPTVIVERGAGGSIASLLDRSGKPYWCEKHGVKYGCALFMGITVTWREA